MSSNQSSNATNRIQDYLTSTYNRRNEDEVSQSWKRIDHFKVRNLASPSFVKCFYISFLIGLLLFLLALILFLLPVKTESKERENQLEDSISTWSYTPIDQRFREALFKISFQKSSYTRKDIIWSLKKTDTYKYPVDSYYPTYDEMFHLRTSTTKEDNRVTPMGITNKNQPEKKVTAEQPTFTLQKGSDKPDEQLLANQCVQFMYTNANKSSLLKNMTECTTSSGNKGFNFQFLKPDPVVFTAECQGIDESECEKLCKQRQGVLLFHSDNKTYTCDRYSVARVLCIGVKLQDIDNATNSNFLFSKGCFLKNSISYYSSLEYGEKADLNNLVAMVRDEKDPYIRAYELSMTGKTFFNLNVDSMTSAFIKWLVFISGMIFVSLFFMHSIISLANENEIMKYNLHQRSLSFFLDR